MNPKQTFSLTPAALPRKTTLLHGPKLSAEEKAAVRLTPAAKGKKQRTLAQMPPLHAEVLRMVLAGRTLKEIGFDLGISQGYLSELLEKQGIGLMRITRDERAMIVAHRKGGL